MSETATTSSTTSLLMTAKKNGIVGFLIVAMFLTGLLTNQLSDKNPLLIPHPEWCYHSSLHSQHLETIANMTSPKTLTTTARPQPEMTEASSQETLYIPTMPRGLAETTAVFCFIWPLLPMLLNSRNTFIDAKREFVMSHVLGQTSNFGIAEVFRTQIALPEDLFLDKCNLTPEECLRLSQEKIALPLYEPQDSNHPSLCRGQFKAANNASHAAYNDRPIIYNSLHHYPDPVCMLFGSSLVSFIATIMHWGKLNPTQKKLYQTSATVRSILTVSDIAMLSSLLFYLYNLYVAYDLMQVLGIVVGIVLQLLIHRTVSYRQPQRNPTDGVPMARFNVS